MNSFRAGYKPDFKKPIPPTVENETQPAHYHTGNIDVIKFAEENFSVEERRGFYRMNALKYTTRYHLKDGMRDLKKAQFYLNKLIELEGEVNG